MAVSPLPTKGVMLYETIRKNCDMGNLNCCIFYL